MKIRVVVTGRNYHTAAPVPEELELGEGQSVDNALAALTQYLPEGQSFPGSCLVVVSGQHLGTVSKHQPRSLRDGDELALIAPVAGG
ncbi:MAG: MoaD/ThiS family protein [Pirellulaceae bacterium]|nr:MoaD/ThiS family protein [Pirellulaceae bacterium]